MIHSDPDELQSAASSYAAGVQGTTPAPPPTRQGGSSDDTIDSGSIEDASGTISFDVPAEWTDVDRSPSNDFISVQASADLPTFTELGAFLEVYPSNNGTDDAADAFDAVRASLSRQAAATASRSTTASTSGPRSCSTVRRRPT